LVTPVLVRGYRSATKKTTTRQSGIALLAMLGLVGLLVALFVFGLVDNSARSNETGQRTAEALAQARQALIGYAGSYRDRNAGEVFGYLPCPDISTTGSEGSAETSASRCATRDVTVIGRLPWRTLGLPPLRDGDGECLWYAVSGNFKANLNKTDLMNGDTNGLIEIMAPDGSNFVAGGSGTTADPAMRAAAVIFSPGAVLSGQGRAPPGTSPPEICGGNYDAAAYLDTDVASSINNAAASTTANELSRFIAAMQSHRTPAVNDKFNDRLMPIFPDEIFSRHLENRADFESHLTDPLTGLLRKAADCLLAYGRSNDRGVDGKYLPWATQMTLTGYGKSLNYIDTDDDLGGRLPYKVSKTAVAEAGPNHHNLNYDYDGGNEPLLRETLECSGWSGVDEFWDNWKDHLFYAVADGHNVRHHDGHQDDPCDDNECIEVENPAPDPNTTGVAAVVIFAGARQSSQTRNNDANPSYSSDDKANPANYLEGDNLTAIQLNPSGSDANRLFSKIDGNDAIMCLVTEMNVVTEKTELNIDPTCGTSARCALDGPALAAYGTPPSGPNTCRVGTSGINPACQTIADRIGINNCPGSGTTYSCKRAARDFLNYDCLQGFASTKCQGAHTALTTCS
jgi:hypothetical protein